MRGTDARLRPSAGRTLPSGRLPPHAPLPVRGKAPHPLRSRERAGVPRHRWRPRVPAARTPHRRRWSPLPFRGLRSFATPAPRPAAPRGGLPTALPRIRRSVAGASTRCSQTIGREGPMSGAYAMSAWNNPAWSSDRGRRRRAAPRGCLSGQDVRLARGGDAHVVRAGRRVIAAGSGADLPAFRCAWKRAEASATHFPVDPEWAAAATRKPASCAVPGRTAGVTPLAVARRIRRSLATRVMSHARPSGLCNDPEWPPRSTASNARRQSHRLPTASSPVRAARWRSVPGIISLLIPPGRGDRG